MCVTERHGGRVCPVKHTHTDTQTGCHFSTVLRRLREREREGEEIKEIPKEEEDGGEEEGCSLKTLRDGKFV